MDLMPVYQASILIWAFFIYSCSGWVYEVIVALVLDHKFENRGFVLGPMCPIYGVGALLGVVCFHGIQDPILLFLAGGTAACVIEYVTSYVMEKLFHARWWDYSNFHFNLNGRICLIGFLMFGLMIVLVDRVVHPWVAGLISSWDPLVTVFGAGALMVVFSMDLAATVVRMQGFNAKLAEAQELIDRLADSTRDRALLARTQAAGLAADVRESMTEAAGEIQSTFAEAADVLQAKASDVRDSLTAQAGTARVTLVQGIESLKDNKLLRNLVNRERRSLEHLSGYYEFKAMNDGAFRSTRYAEALALLKGALQREEEELAGLIGYDGDASDPDPVDVDPVDGDPAAEAPADHVAPLEVACDEPVVSGGSADR